MAPTSLLLLLCLSAAAAAEQLYGRGYAIGATPRRRVLLKSLPRRLAYAHKATAVYRSPSDSYDEADAVRTADRDLGHKPDILYKPPYTPAVVHKKPVHQPAHHAVHVTKDAHHHVKHVAPAPHVPHVKPYHYDYEVAPACALVNHHLYNITVCLEDAEYPTETILHALKENPPLTARLMSDVTYQSADNLVDGLTKAEEEQYSREHYYGVATHDEHVPITGSSYSTAYKHGGGYLCPSDVFYARVKRAVNTFGQWKVVVNLPDEFVHDPEYKKFVQTSRLENCVHPGAPCSFVDHLVTACLQKHAFTRLVVWDYERGLHVDSFKMPTACSCHLKAKPALFHA